MAIPKITRQNVLDALKKLDKDGWDSHRDSMQYDLVTEDGKRYPPKYVIAVAAELLTGSKPSAKSYGAESRRILENLGFMVKPKQHVAGCRKFSSMLLESKNLIFHGAPGTGKSYLAKTIAADIISGGCCDDYASLSDEQKKQVEFVQFHPSYDYSDFVEGLRPCINDDGTMGFELRDGIFKRFIARARKNYEDSQKSQETVEKELSAQEAIIAFFSSIDIETAYFETVHHGKKFTIESFDDERIRIYIPGNTSYKEVSLRTDKIRQMLESEETFEQVQDVRNFFGDASPQPQHSYILAIYKETLKHKKYLSGETVKVEELKKYIFIIDEINRGEISKIFGELFFAVDPGYRGRAGEISTQYAHMHDNPDEKFFIPENVYIIGTMNDIDRSVDSFDFAMRRRFRFVELKADEHVEMLAGLDDDKLIAEAVKRMSSLNRAIADAEDLNENYQIGAAYFLKLKTLQSENPEAEFRQLFHQLWTDHLRPLLQEYIRGMYDESGLMSRFEKAYRNPREHEDDEAAQDQG